MFFHVFNKYLPNASFGQVLFWPGKVGMPRLVMGKLGGGRYYTDPLVSSLANEHYWVRGYSKIKNIKLINPKLLQKTDLPNFYQLSNNYFLFLPSTPQSQKYSQNHRKKEKTKSLQVAVRTLHGPSEVWLQRLITNYSARVGQPQPSPSMTADTPLHF